MDCDDCKEASGLDCKDCREAGCMGCDNIYNSDISEALEDKGPERPDHEKYTYITKWSEDDGTFVSRVLEFNSLTSEGGSPENAVTKMISLVICVLENMKNLKEEIPEPVNYKQVSRLINRFSERYEIEIHYVEIRKDLYEKGLYINGELEMEGQTALLETWMSDFEDYPLNISKYRRIFHKRNSPVGRCIFHGSGFPETLESLNDIVNNGHKPENWKELGENSDRVSFQDIKYLLKTEESQKLEKLRKRVVVLEKDLKMRYRNEIEDKRIKDLENRVEDLGKLFEDKLDVIQRIGRVFEDELANAKIRLNTTIKSFDSILDDFENRLKTLESSFSQKITITIKLRHGTSGEWIAEARIVDLHVKARTKKDAIKTAVTAINKILGKEEIFLEKIIEITPNKYDIRLNVGDYLKLLDKIKYYQNRPF